MSGPRRGGTRIATGGLIALTTCVSEREFQPIVLDISPNCSRAEVTRIVRDLDAPGRPWTRVLAALADDPTGRRYWLLVEYNDEAQGFDRLGLWHVREGDTPDEGIIDETVPIDVVPNEAHDLQLVAGPTPGQAYLVHDAEGMFRLWRVDVTDPAGPLQAISGNLAGFPGSIARLCPTDDGNVLGTCDVSDWPRHLAFLDGVPHIIAPAPFSPSATTFVYSARLEANLVVAEQSQLEFFKPCDENAPIEEFTACDQEKQDTTYPALEVLGVQQDSRAGEWTMFLLRYREIRNIGQSWEPVVLDLRLDDSNNPEGGLRSQTGETASHKMATPGPPSGLAVDDFAAYLMHSTTLDGPTLTRLADDGIDFEDLAIFDLDETSMLLQLDGDIALGRLADDGWEVTKLFPDAPEQSQTTVWRDSGRIDRVEPAGVGAFLLFLEEGGPDLVTVRCVD